MAKVTFACECPQSHVEALIEDAAARSKAGRLLFEQSGKKSLTLAAGTYSVAYRAQGTPKTPFLLKTVEGGAMKSVDRLVPPDGKAAGVRTLTVAARLIEIAVLLALLRPTQARAQSGQGPGEDRKQAERSLTTVPNVSDVLRSGYYLTLQAGADSKTGTATIAIENTLGSLAASLSMTGPLDQATKQALPLTLDALPNSGAAGLGLHWFHWPNRPDVVAMRRLCQRMLKRDDCDDDELTDPADRSAFIRLAHAGDRPSILNFRGTAGREAFNYVDRSTLAGQSVVHNNWTIAVGVGRYTPQVGYVAIEYEHQHQFRAGEAVQICQTTPANVLQCRSAVVGAPKEETREIGRVEWRRFFPGGRVALNPSLARDFRNDVTSADLPLYFLALSSGGLAGGARASWRSDTKNVAVALFVGTALRLTP